MNRLEIYAIILAVFGLSLTAAYFKGRFDMQKAITTKQLADNAAALQKANDELTKRAEADDKARKLTEDFIDRVTSGLGAVNAKFAKLPNVVMDAHGCADLNDNFRLRWNSGAGVLGASGQGAGEPGAAVRGAVVSNP